MSGLIREVIWPVLIDDSTGNQFTCSKFKSSKFLDSLYNNYQFIHNKHCLTLKEIHKISRGFNSILFQKNSRNQIFPFEKFY